MRAAEIGPVVVQRRDPHRRTHLYWYLDEAAAQAGDCVAHVSANVLYVDTSLADEDIRARAVDLHQQLMREAWADLTCEATHRDAEPGGPVVLIDRSVGGAA